MSFDPIMDPGWFWVGGTAVATAFLVLRRQKILPFADAMAPAALLGYAIYRIGCFINGCGFGTSTSAPWGVRYAPGTNAYADHMGRGWIAPGEPLSLAVHPAQLYSAGLAFVLFLILLHLRSAPVGARIGCLALGYGISRFGLEFLRGDNAANLGGLSLAQMFSLTLVAGGLVLLWRCATSTVALGVLAGPVRSRSDCKPAG